MSEFKTLSRSVKGLTVLVTGAASGMGRATARVFAAEGANVAVSDIGMPKPRRPWPTRSPRAAARPRPGSSTSPTATRSSRSSMPSRPHFGGLDIVVNNAGISVRVAIDDDGYEDAWARGLAIMLTAHPRIIRAALPYLRKSKCPRIVNIASTEALGATALHSPYSAAKAGVAGLTPFARGRTRSRRHHGELHLPRPDHHGDHGPDLGRAQGDLCPASHRTRPLRRSRGGRPHDAKPVPAGGILPDWRGDSGRRRADGAECLSLPQRTLRRT